MLYLIGGAPRCGKTTFAKMLAHKKRISWVSTDGIAAVIEPYIPAKNRATLLPFGDACSTDPQTLLAYEITNAKTCWSGIKCLILGLLRWNHDFIVEGVHLMPELLHTLESDPYWPAMHEHVRIVFFIKHNEESIIRGFKNSNPESDWLLQCMKTESDLRHAATMVSVKSRFIETQAFKFGYNVVNTEGNFKKTLQLLLKEF